MIRGLSHPSGLAGRSAAGARVLLVLFYLALGLSAAWHAPHFSQGSAAVDTDRHEHHEAVNGDSCLLCTVKNAPHQAVAAIVPGTGTEVAGAFHAVSAPVLATGFAAFLARGPPALLS